MFLISESKDLTLMSIVKFESPKPYSKWSDVKIEIRIRSYVLGASNYFVVMLYTSHEENDTYIIGGQKSLSNCERKPIGL